MRKQLSVSLLVLTLCISAAAQPAEESPLKIRGQVTDASGRPVFDAVVSAHRDPSRGRAPFATTDELGRFTLAITYTGKYLLAAGKEGEGYPFPGNPFYNPSEDAMPTVIVEKGQEVPFVRIQLGPKAGSLSGYVKDAETGQPIPDAQINICRAEAPRYCHRVADRLEHGRFAASVPPVPITVQISADGYQDWAGSDGGRHLEVIRVESGTARKLNVSLRKSLAGADGSQPHAGLGAPRIVSPADGTRFSDSPRTIRLEWSAVEGAVSYTVEVDYCADAGADGKQCGDPRPLQLRRNPPMSGIVGTSYEFIFIGGQPGRWRVWAVDGEGRVGAKSPWVKFFY